VSGADRATIESHAGKLAALIDPAKLATLATRDANPRIQKAVAILADAESKKLDPTYLEASVQDFPQAIEARRAS
jgi:hypothetical protein